MSYFSLTLLFTLYAYFVDYAFVIVVIKESYYYYYYYYQMRHNFHHSIMRSLVQINIIPILRQSHPGSQACGIF